jgi:predicted DNA-binding ArsR family transcriptional regulator
MSETQDWLETNQQHLRGIARTSNTAPEVVDLAAVLVLAEFSDDQINDRLRRLVLSLGAGRRPILALPQVIAAIRALAIAETTKRSG